MEYQQLFNKLSKTESDYAKAAELLRTIWFLVNDEKTPSQDTVKFIKDYLNFNVKDPTKKHTS